MDTTLNLRIPDVVEPRCLSVYTRRKKKQANVNCAATLQLRRVLIDFYNTLLSRDSDENLKVCVNYAIYHTFNVTLHHLIDWLIELRFSIPLDTK